VGLALDRVGFTVEDRDRSKGLYFVRYIDPQIDNAQPQKSEGFLSKLKFWGSSDPKSKKTEQYRIQVKEIGSGAQVYVLNKDGLEENTETSRRILSLLHEQLK
jgi:outer membrane protein assembly factor BamC